MNLPSTSANKQKDEGRREGSDLQPLKSQETFCVKVPFKFQKEVHLSNMNSKLSKL